MKLIVITASILSLVSVAVIALPNSPSLIFGTGHNYPIKVVWLKKTDSDSETKRIRIHGPHGFDGRASILISRLDDLIPILMVTISEGQMVEVNMPPGKYVVHSRPVDEYGRANKSGAWKLLGPMALISSENKHYNLNL